MESLFYIMNFLMGVFGVIVLALTYTYIDKMEKLGCACAEYKYRKFIKTWTLISIAIVGVMIFVPLKMVNNFNEQLGAAYSVFHFLFLIIHVVYLIMTLMYIDHLVKEKCKCSEDIRRELLYVWFILRAIILLALVVLPLFVKLGLTSVAFINRSSNKIVSSSTTPNTKDLQKVPKSLRRSFDSVRKSFKKSD
jgi:hypothetical protein